MSVMTRILTALSLWLLCCCAVSAQAPMGIPYGGGGCPALSGSTGVLNGCTGATTGQQAMSNLSGVYVLCRSSGVSAHTGDATETALGTCTVPANAMGANGRLVITYQGECTNDATTKTWRIRWSGASGTIMNQIPVTTSGVQLARVEIANLNATNSQVTGSLALGTFGSGGAAITAAVDTTQTQTLVFTGQLGATTTDNIQLDYWEVLLITTAGN